MKATPQLKDQNVDRLVQPVLKKKTSDSLVTTCLDIKVGGADPGFISTLSARGVQTPKKKEEEEVEVMDSIQSTSHVEGSEYSKVSEKGTLGGTS